MKKYIQVLIALILIGAAIFVFYDYYKETNRQAEFEESISQGEIYDSDGNEIQYGANKGDKVYDYELTDMVTGETSKISDYHGKRAYMFFWASWCPHCKNQAPILQELHEEHDDIMVIGVNLHDTESNKDTPLEFIEELGLTYLNVNVQDEMLDTFYIQSTPTSLFINSEGIIEEGVVGGLPKEVIESRFDRVD